MEEPSLLSMRDSMKARGPDDAGIHMGPGVALGARRLSILDLSERGHMPMSTPDGRYWITYNGEVYNYRELRARLESLGCTFRSGTDTEVVLQLYAAEGPAMLERLNGMFAIAIWDSQERCLFLARDRLGVKPLYYTSEAGRLYFASEEKALFAAGIPARFDPAVWEELLCFRYVAGERTPFEGIRRLLPGHYLTWRGGRSAVRRWWNLADRAAAMRDGQLRSGRDARTWFRETFDSAVDLRRISDVPVGVLLSGGLDSSSVASSLAAQAGDGIASFTVRFREHSFDEGPLAKEVAARWSLDYHELLIPPDQLPSLLTTTSWLNDEPLVHGNDLFLFAIASYAKTRVTVLLSGEGGDETLGGYVRYRPLQFYRMARAGQALLKRARPFGGWNGRFGKLERYFATGGPDRLVLFNACDQFPADLEALGMEMTGRFAFREDVVSEAQALYPRDLARQAMYGDLRTFLCSILDRNDRMTMGASIECRVPFLDYRLVEGLAALPSSVLLAGLKGKPLLRRSIGDRLPESVRKHRKWGFAVPWSTYLRETGELREMVIALPERDPIRGGPFARGRVREVVRRFLAGDTSVDSIVRQLLMIAVWYEAVVTRAADEHSVRLRA